MKKILLLAILATTFVALAQNKISLTIIDPVDGDKFLDIELQSTETVEINSLGDVTATTVWAGVGGFEDALDTANISVGGTAPGVSFTCTSSADCITISAAQTTVTVSVTPGATYCNEYAGASTIPFKVTTNSVDPYITQLTRVINSSTSSTYSVECGNNGGSSTKQTINVSLATVPNVSISPNSQAVSSGSTLNITWTHSANANECIFNGDWPSGTTINSYISTGSGSGFPSPNFSFTNMTTAKTLTVNCKNAIGTSVQAQQTYSISGSTGSSWTTCTNGAVANPILGGNEDRSILSGGALFGGPPSNPSDYNGLYETLQGSGITSPFPGGEGDLIHYTLEKNKYIAAKFTTSNIDYDSSINSATPTNQEGTNSLGRTMTISTCPGDFSNNLSQARCITTTGDLYFSTKNSPSGPPGFFCELDKNTTYYLNIVDSDNSENNNYQTTDCPDPNGYCGNLASRIDISF